MDKILTLKDFKWIPCNKEKEIGFYSYKENGWEICLDEDVSGLWTIYLSNKFEEVLEEHTCGCEEKVLELANKIYREFDRLHSIYD